MAMKRKQGTIVTIQKDRRSIGKGEDVIMEDLRSNGKKTKMRCLFILRILCQMHTELSACSK